MNEKKYASLPSLRDADNGSRGAMEHRAAGIPHAPIDVVMHAHAVTGTLTRIGVAQTTATRRDTATVVVTDQIVLTILGVVTCANPRHLRGFGAWRTLINRSAAAAA